MAGGCASIAKDKMEHLQAQLRCGMSVEQVEAIVGERIKTLDVPTPEATHLYRRGFGDLRFKFEEDKLRVSQIVVVTGWEWAEEEPIVDHCK